MTGSAENMSTLGVVGFDWGGREGRERGAMGVVRVGDWLGLDDARL